MRRLSFLLLMTFLLSNAHAQVKVTDMPTYSGILPTGSWIPNVVSGVNRKVDGGQFTQQGNTFNAANALLKLNVSGYVNYSLLGASGAGTGLRYLADDYTWKPISTANYQPQRAAALFSPYGSNPTLTNGAEVSMLLQTDGVTVDQWYRLVGGTTFYHRQADNALLTNWTSPTTLTGVDGEFPTVFKHGATYYMIVKRPATTGNIFLYSSANGLTGWTVTNGGTAIITKSATATDWYANLYNVGVCMAGNTMHILVEGSATSGAYSGTAWVGYATANISAPTMTMTATPLFEGGNAQLMYVPENNSILALYGEVFPNYSIGHWRLREATASLAYDLTKTSSWVISSTTGNNLGLDVADPEIVFTPGKTHSALLYYNYDQSTGHQAYLDNVTTALELYQTFKMTGGINETANLHKLGIGGTNPPQQALELVDSKVYGGGVYPVTASMYSTGLSATGGNAFQFGYDNSHYGAFVWDRNSPAGLYIQTTSNAYGININGSSLKVTSPTTFSSTVANYKTDPYMSIPVGYSTTRNMEYGWDNAGSMGYIGTYGNSFPLQVNVPTTFLQNVTVAGGNGYIAQTASGTNRSIKFSTESIMNDFGAATLRTATGTNTSSVLIISPRGTGASGISTTAGIWMYNTDYVADPSNSESFFIDATSGGNYSIRSNATGTGVVRPLYITAGGGSNLIIQSDGGVTVGTSTPVASAILALESTTRGFLPPRMTTAQRTTLAATAAEGMIVYDTDTKKSYTYDGSTWQAHF